MNKKKFEVFFNLSYTQLSIGIFKKINNKTIFLKDYEYENYDLDLNKIEEIISRSIFDIEKITGEFLNDIYLMIEVNNSEIISLSLDKNNEGQVIKKKDVLYLIQDAKIQIEKCYPFKKISHIILKNYNIDNENFRFFPKDINCKKFSIDLDFICFHNSFVNSLEKLFNKNQILLNKIICSEYARRVAQTENYSNICEIGFKLVNGLNIQEVELIPKTHEKKGFFEKLFYLFR
tara:strand:- start:12 stop:710 length:699 start_codon:yes stop_codon:yes gene_type:complete